MEIATMRTIAKIVKAAIVIVWFPFSLYPFYSTFCVMMQEKKARKSKKNAVLCAQAGGF
jgi:hypothetical protein